MKLSILKKIVYSFGLALIILLLIGGSSYYYLFQLKNDILIHHNSFIEKQLLSDLLSSLKDAQRGERGYLLTGKRTYLTPFSRSIKKIYKLLNELSSMHNPNSIIQDNIKEIEEKTNASLKIYLNIINEYKNTGYKSSLKLLEQGDGNKFLDEIESKIGYLNYIDSQSLNKRLGKINTSLNYIFSSIIGGFLLGVFVSGFAVFALKQDIARRIKYELDLKSAKEAAEKSDRLKSEFLAQISHEIRTPINSILSFTNYLQVENSNVPLEDKKEIFDIINQAGNRITRTIDLILNMSEVQTGSYQPHYKLIDLHDNIISNISAGFERLANNKNLKYIISKNTDDTRTIGDEYTLNQIFDNLINNAIKYTHSGQLETIFERDINNKLCVKISDTGIGISQDFLNKIFEPFSQEEQGYTRKFEGNGLGLALVKKYCELNNATISVKSKKGTGTTFTVTFNN